MIIGLVGRKQSGKDTCARFLQELSPFTRVAFADKMRKAYYDLNPMVGYTLGSPDYLQDIVDAMGWDWAKEHVTEVRRGLQRFGTEMGRENFGSDFWVDLAWEEVSHWEVSNHRKNFVITDVRFENEIAKVKAWKGQIWRIERGDQAPDDPNDPLMNHPSERAWRDTKPDRVIYNPGPSHPRCLDVYRARVEAGWVKSQQATLGVWIP